MSYPASVNNDYDDSMDFDEESVSAPSGISEGLLDTGDISATILRDSVDSLTKIRSLRESDVLVLLTPVVVPVSRDVTDTSDPFECFGRSLAKRHAKVRHIPTHKASLWYAVMEQTCKIRSPSHSLLTSGYTAEEMEAAAAVIFGEREPNPKVGLAISGSGTMEAVRPKLWAVDNGMKPGTYQVAFTSLLRRPGYAKHYVVRDPRGSEVLGFCATYLSYVDQEGERLIASLAILLVEKTVRRQGIGLSLHNHAIGQLRSTRGVIRLQLGSTFPRLLLGPLHSLSPNLTANDEWFRRRGWTLDKKLQGQGQSVYDLILDFTKWNYRQSQQQEGFDYRQSAQDDMIKVLRLVEEASIKQGNMGWFDQYFALMNAPNVKDIILCLEGDEIIATALTYTPSCGSSISSNLPWARRIGHDVGGVTCICVSPQRKESPIIPELLNACVKKLYRQGMRRMFFDGVAKDVDELKRLGNYLHYEKVLSPAMKLSG
ncbi:hypothetical protein DID88_004875 [Monilinia fructigena]|uniref:N-acetyltransferase domain-containing protein n=1 Tax=Monilinia fructigena TaxID=38457 RepID=A0A395IVD5_9HELO|nr:hypothetical protein DID88_004875 [Monilinia fructigena]